MAAAVNIWIKRMGTPEANKWDEETPTRRFGFQPPTVQTGKAYHIRVAWPNAADTRRFVVTYRIDGG
jgi:hypothetical protein